MHNEEKIKRVLNILQCYLLNERQKYDSSDEYLKENVWELGAAWMAGFVLENYKDLDFDKLKADNVLKTRPLYDPDVVESVMEDIRNSHIDMAEDDLITKKGNLDRDNSKQSCKLCNYAKKKRPDGIAMLAVNVWCTRIRKEMPGSLKCAVGKWGFF